jgi:hypothetical protein
MSRLVNRKTTLRFGGETPTAIFLDGEWVPVELVDSWRVSDEWWLRSDARLGETDYFRLTASPPRSGTYLVTFRRTTQEAVLERAHD